jgi:hypothetical protein
VAVPAVEGGAWPRALPGDLSAGADSVATIAGLSNGKAVAARPFLAEANPRIAAAVDSAAPGQSGKKLSSTERN